MGQYYRAVAPWVFGGLAAVAVALLLWIGHVL